MASPDTKMCQPLLIPLILCKTRDKNKNFSYSVTMHPKIFVLFEIRHSLYIFRLSFRDFLGLASGDKVPDAPFVLYNSQFAMNI